MFNSVMVPLSTVEGLTAAVVEILRVCLSLLGTAGSRSKGRVCVIEQYMAKKGMGIYLAAHTDFVFEL